MQLCVCTHVLVVLTPPAAEAAVSTAGAGVEARLTQRHVGPRRRRLIRDRLLNKRQLGLQRSSLWAVSLVLHLSFDTQKRSQVQVQPHGASSRYRSVLTALRTRDPQLHGGKTRHWLNSSIILKLVLLFFLPLGFLIRTNSIH